MDNCPPIILIHAFPTDGSLWHHQVSGLSTKGYRVLAPHLPGFGPDGAKVATAWMAGGGLERGGDKYTLESLAEYLRDWLYRPTSNSGAGLAPGTKVIFGGCSMGGSLVLTLLRLYPELIAGAMLFDCRATADAPEAKANRQKVIETIQHDPGAGINSLINGMLPRSLAPEVNAEVRAEVKTLMERQSALGIVGIQHAMGNRIDQTSVLPTIKVPVLMVVGAEDVISPPSVMLGMKGQVPQALLAQIAGAGHLPMIEQPEAVNQIMADFLATFHT